ncbi:MAG: proline--tRNA ligase [Planctomycetes bacterium RIFCSPHIGHO2_02_FULL_50_42]|nr:MAG: proline--tRNA ligase [Planctomycetes bacterium RIFCSPHIGHO2_02_FULL_50_42]OHB92682.1 MAG: proline--tRNA ligase [Planctomycetes bacterium RIFCSPHIGHO2_12_FULL_51_37]OHB95579.1 MAG: proline--tRNA ligase [Planctomycetes bacterium RIFCSPLOWO2_02_FULL_50_16]OHC03726.1 MAG: proline--tRNA ligase [Planctomycetes bacterium RIFCSPLOWO2_12_FULL_50_35]
MKWSQTLIPTLKEDPTEAEITSHKLMIRSGMIRKLLSGAYSYLPLGTRVLNKVVGIIREEMDRAGAIEVYLPALQPLELLEASGRIDVFGQDLIRFEDRHGRTLALGPTHEEVVTHLVRNEISSYRQLPITLYQIQMKFRDEVRPRFGVLRSKEFLMKDAYSFEINEAGLDKSYKAMYNAYCRIFDRCGLKYIPVEADTGAMGGDVSHEFMVPSEVGEDLLARCKGCDYSVNMEKAEPAPLPAVQDVQQVIRSVPTPKVTTIGQVSEFLKIEPNKLVKTLIYKVGGEPVAVLVRGDHEVNEIRLAKVLGQDGISLADEETITNVTGAPMGFTGPVGLNIKIIADQAVSVVKNCVTGANKADTHLVNVNPGRDFKINRVENLRYVVEGDTCPKCGEELVISRGIEVGHVFKLGTKYSKALDAKFLDSDGVLKPMLMGCYGIGVNRIIAALIECSHDKDGIIWSPELAPYQVLVLPLNVKDKWCLDAALRIHDELEGAGVETLLDDRDQRPGIKFKDADLIGIPYRVVVGKKYQDVGQVEVQFRGGGEALFVTLDRIVPEIKKLFGS